MSAGIRASALAAAAALAAALPVGASAAAEPAANLTLRQLAGQRIVYSFPGARPPAALRRRIRRGEAAGVILFRRNIRSRADLRSMLRGLQAIRRPPGLRAPLLVMIDQEGGLVKRLPGAPSHSPAQLGRIGSIRLALREGRATGRNLRGVGVNVNLAPVLDVGRPGSFQRRLGRSFGGSARLVSGLGPAFARGLQQRRVAATLKHFPGLGTVARDEDAAVQRVRLPLRVLRRVDERPFQAGVRLGAKLVMTSTALYPALSRRPALLSRRISTGELRGRLGFRGVSITDDLDVPALRPYGGPERLALRAARAGNDLLLFAGGYASGREALAALVRAARSGRLDRRGLRVSATRVLSLRAALAQRTRTAGPASPPLRTR